LIVNVAAMLKQHWTNWY